MAATDNSLSREFECAICFDELKQPKFIGPCNHTFCKDCIDKLWTSGGSSRTVRCPQCRKECPIPSTGGGGLKDNFTVANIIERYRNQQRTAANQCTLCRNTASCFCKDCDLKLCPKCKGRHDRDQEKRDHDLFDLCPSHGNGLWLFCNPCKQAVCGGCKVSDHEEGVHDVKSIRQIIDHLVLRIQANSADLADADREQETELSRLRDMVQQKSTSAEVRATAVVERTIADKTYEIRGLNKESQDIQRQMNRIIRKKEAVDERTKQLVRDADNLKGKKTKVLSDVRELLAKPSEEINLRLRSLDTRRKEIKNKSEQGRAVGSTKITIDTESIATLTRINQELTDLVKVSRESGTRTVIEEITRSISDLGRDIGDMGQGVAVMIGDHQIRDGQTKQVFRLLKKVCNVAFPNNRPCKVLYRLKHLPDSRVASLGRSQGDGADTICLHDKVSSALTGMITEGLQPAYDMAVSSAGKVVVARLEKPPIRILEPATGAYRDINTSHEGDVIDTACYVETDDSDNVFVSTGKINPLLLVLKPNGNVVQSVPLRGFVDHMAFCSHNRILYIAVKGRILRFHWGGNILRELSSSSNGVPGFHCSDVCIGGGGEVLVAGLVENEDIGIYQVAERDDEESLVWRKIEYEDCVKRASRDSPHICISDDNLWLGYDDKMEKFQLV